ncbi:hydrogenase subunit MbhD domain-containing protein [Marispirochaeta aestuarii]|uniref:hydrogenase subunit MbhD domain-containing protein n=1 Tax=Marispirochaeta aestuarii TaxID=1963862 RepID=UPI0029C7251A|nr:hydrogenase subunit MbhD domain-containing protein [Marispirochaeta aestuarii]
MMIEVLLALMLITAVISLQVRDMLAAVLTLSVFSLLSCLVFFLFHAPDVALTEAAVGTGVGTVVMIWIVYKTERRDET